MDKRDQFEAYFAKRTSCTVADIVALRRGDGYTLTASYLQTLWEGWQAHAAITDDPAGAIERSKHILALVDEYAHKQTKETRDTLRHALLREFAPTAPDVAARSPTDVITDEAVQAFNDEFALACNEPADWPAHMVDSVKTAIAAAIKAQQG